MATKKTAAKKKAPSRKKEPEQLYTVELTKSEIEHIRDMFSILLPTDEDVSVSSALAEMKEQSEMESDLWNKLVKLFESAGISSGDSAPDFIIATTTGIYQIGDGEEQ